MSFQTSGYHSEPFGLPIDVYVLTFGGTTATVIVDPHQATDPRARRSWMAAREILESVHVQP